MPVVVIYLVHHLVVLDLIPAVDCREKLGLHPWDVPVYLLMQLLHLLFLVGPSIVLAHLTHVELLCVQLRLDNVRLEGVVI
jgi:hypothetical protein